MNNELVAQMRERQPPECGDGTLAGADVSLQSIIYFLRYIYRLNALGPVDVHVSDFVYAAVRLKKPSSVTLGAFDACVFLSFVVPMDTLLEDGGLATLQHTRCRLKSVTRGRRKPFYKLATNALTAKTFVGLEFVHVPLSCLPCAVIWEIAHDLRNTANIPSRQLMFTFAALRSVGVYLRVLLCVSLTCSTFPTDVTGLFMDVILPSNSKTETSENIR